MQANRQATVQAVNGHGKATTAPPETFLYNEDAERNVLSWSFHNPDDAQHIVSVLTTSDFYFRSHMMAFVAIAWVLRSDIDYDFIALSDALENHRPELATFAKERYGETISEPDFEALLGHDAWRKMVFHMPDPRQFRASLMIVKERATARDVYTNALSLTKYAASGQFDFDDARSVLRGLLDRLTTLGIRRDTTASDSADAFWERYTNRTPVSSYTPALVKGLVSFERGKVYVVAGRPATGKSTLLNQLVRGMAGMKNKEVGPQEAFEGPRLKQEDAKMRVLVIQLEDTDQTFTMRALADMAGVSMTVLRRAHAGPRRDCPDCRGQGHTTDPDTAKRVTCPCQADHQKEVDGKVKAAVERYKALDIRLVTGQFGPEGLRDRVYAEYARRPYDVLVLDYLQNIKTGKRSKMEAVEMANQVMVEAAGDKRDLNPHGLVTLVASQFNRDSATGQGPYEYTPQLANLRQTGEIEQSATAVLGIGYEVDADGHMKPSRRLHCLKNRDGDGHLPPAQYHFQGQYMRFVRQA